MSMEADKLTGNKIWHFFPANCVVLSSYITQYQPVSFRPIKMRGALFIVKGHIQRLYWCHLITVMGN